MALRAVVFACLVALYHSETVYNPPEAGGALDAVEDALKKIIDNPRLPAQQLAAAKKVVADVESTVEFLESANGKALSKQAHDAKVMAAIKELQDLQTSWQQAATVNVEDKKAELLKQLKEKEAELAKDQKMMKVLNLEKKLAEKKLALQNLIDAKHAKEAAASQQEQAKELAEHEQMIASVLAMAKEVQSSKGADASMAHAVKNVTDGKPKLLASVNSYLQGRMKTLSGNMADLDAAQNNREAMIKTTLGAKDGGKADDKELKKSAAILTMLMNKEKRNYKKARAVLQSEYNELADAVKSIKKGDVKSLSKVMTHMQDEMKTLQAKSHKFLY
jgi:hypothetical protein